MMVVINSSQRERNNREFSPTLRVLFSEISPKKNIFVAEMDEPLLSALFVESQRQDGSGHTYCAFPPPSSCCFCCTSIIRRF